MTKVVVDVADVCKQQGVTGYPTFHYYRQGEFVSKYSGARSKQAFLDFFSEQQKQQEQAAKQEEQAAKQEKQPLKQEEQPPKQPPKQEQEQKAKAKTKKEEL